MNSNQDTEFNEALRKHGILPPLDPRSSSPSPPPSPNLDDILEELTTAELQELEEDMDDDDAERYIAQHRAQRLAQERLEGQRGRFGAVLPIGRDDYTREVTEASKQNEVGDDEARGTGVVCFLYKEGIPRSDRAHTHICTLATRYPRTKFVSIVGDKCIPNLPDSRVPMFIAYRKGEIVTQITAWGSDRERKLEELEALFITSGIIIPPKKLRADTRVHLDDESEEENENYNHHPRVRSTSTLYSTKDVRNVSKKDDSDSDFDFDL
ncbi:thioredoxin-like protein [Multifurca ochricompacta]|uniref:Thioredoxin-like protein n=1 Tax=Multifurca ochricompacta TaxID=376703 RepID=A0AAD4M6X6_9AGAM|nr:thioredoxin-like protein [Multifurca ochricompacta]